MAKRNFTDSAQVQVSDVGQQLAVELANDPVLTPLFELEDGFIAVNTMLDAFDNVAGNDAPPWLFVIRAEFQRLEAAMDRVSVVARNRLESVS